MIGVAPLVTVELEIVTVEKRKYYKRGSNGGG